MNRPPGIETGELVVSPDSAWYARVLLLLSTTGSKSFDCALGSTMGTYDDPENGDDDTRYFNYSAYIHCFHYSLVKLVEFNWISGFT